MTSVISIQSSVSYGHVGNSAAVFPLQRLGIDVWPVNTVLLSNHPGHGGCRGRAQTPSDLEDILAGMEELDVFSHCDALLTGYLADPGLGPLVLETCKKLKARNPKCVFACDPVMGDHARFFVAEGLPAFFKRQAIATADLMTPNTFELAYLSDMPAGNMSDALAAARNLCARGPSQVLVTSLESPERSDQIGMLWVDRSEALAVFTPKLDVRLNGTGDCLSALTLAHKLRGCEPREILELVADTMFELVDQTHKAGSKELLLVKTQEALVMPQRRFKAFRP